MHARSSARMVSVFSRKVPRKFALLRPISSSACCLSVVMPSRTAAQNVATHCRCRQRSDRHSRTGPPNNVRIVPTCNKTGMGTGRLDQESPRQTKPKKGQFMNFSRGQTGTKVRCESRLFSQGKTPEFRKMGEIHELFILALSLVWFAGAIPDWVSTTVA